MPDPISIAIVAEDELSMAVAERIVDASGRSFVVSRRLVERGFGNIKRSIKKYRQASHVVPHLVLADLDRTECPALLRRQWYAEDLPGSMLFRVAVREIESWILGDCSGFARFASIATNKVPVAPEILSDPKGVLIGLVRRSRNRRLAAEMVPAHGSSVPIGPLYNERLGSFVRDRWNLETAAGACPSLKRMQARLITFLV